MFGTWELAANRSFFGTAEMDIKFALTGAMVPTRLAYSESLKQGLAYLSAEAATSPERFAASSTAPYAVVQCTWDLPSNECKVCIDALSANASDLFAVGIDGERKSYSCRVRYSNSSFTVVPLVAADATTAGLAPSSADRKSNKAIVAGALAGTVFVVGSAMVAVYVFVARNRPTIYERLTKAKGEWAARRGGEGHHERPPKANMSTYEMAAQQVKAEGEAVAALAHQQGERGQDEPPMSASESASQLGNEVFQEYHALERILAGEEDPRDLPLQLLKNITQNFSEDRRIGGGGFGEVYKGVLQNSSIAVKSIIVSENTKDDKLFYSELKSLLRIIEHRNVVRFLGFCANTHQELITTGSRKNLFAQRRERLLCFEYIGNGSLDKHITDESKGLEWDTRYKIIKGICNGLEYLHEEMNIIHLDLKPANIMVDDDMVPKITDFGLARLNGTSTTTTERFATRGYCAPEYLNGGTVTTKCDIYSLGVIIIELVTGQRGIPNEDNVLGTWRNRWGKSEGLKARQVKKCIKIATRCMEKEPDSRPHEVSEIIKSVDIS